MSQGPGHQHLVPVAPDLLPSQMGVERNILGHVDMGGKINPICSCFTSGVQRSVNQPSSDSLTGKSRIDRDIHKMSRSA